jgi:hypothetical protein
MKDGAIRVVLFDVGGVLVETSGVATMLDWMEHPRLPGRTVENVAHLSSGSRVRIRKIAGR